ncbi:unnamed protein product [Hymenolepis diminuta]|uniref:Uncharacterized protein n=1 Tax=Hymenolepis diminuta TaxID=6216 RepID=A0A0R3SNZ5_HYMDI|nr:unnamed protein product [Hymenolepis diminuta]
MGITTLFQKFNNSDHDLYLTYLLSLMPKDLTFEETMHKCKKAFVDETSPFTRRYKCLNLDTRESGDIHKYTGIVNRMTNAFSIVAICFS